MRRWQKAAGIAATMALIGGGTAFAATLTGSNLAMTAGDTVTATCPNQLTVHGGGSRSPHSATLACAPNPATTTTTVAPSTTTTVPASTTTTVAPTTTIAPTTTTTVPASGGNCTNPTFTTSAANGEVNEDGGVGYLWVGNDAWNGSHGPQTMNACSFSSWYAVSTQAAGNTAVETYPNSEYDVGSRSHQSTATVGQLNSITSTFSEAFPTSGNWDAGYDLWSNNWQHEVMIWNQWQGGQGYWPSIAGPGPTLDGVPYTFYKLGSELMLFRTTQTSSGSVDILGAFQWLIANGYLTSADAPTQLQYGVEIASTGGTAETFPVTGLTFAVS